MKKIFLATAIIAVIAFAGCGSSPKAPATTGADELDIAIREASDYLNDNIPNGNKIVILNIQSGSADLSDYVIDEMIANAVNDKLFSVVDRAQLDLIREEQKIQYSGEVDDNAALEIGKFLGAQTIVSGAISKLGNGYRMRIRALDVLTAQVQGQFNRNIAAGSTINMLMASGGGSGGTATATGQTAAGSRTSTGSGTASGSTQTATPAQPAAPAATRAANGTYSFWPRIRATQAGRPIDVYLDKIIVSGGYVTIYITDKPQGNGGYYTFIGNWWNLNDVTLQDLDNPSKRPFMPVKYEQASPGAILVFENVTGKRFSLTTKRPTPEMVFDEITLGEPDA
jgi:TolB-like protein